MLPRVFHCRISEGLLEDNEKQFLYNGKIALLEEFHNLCTLKIRKRSKKAGEEGNSKGEMTECSQSYFLIWCRWKKKSQPPKPNTGWGSLQQASHFAQCLRDLAQISVLGLLTGQTRLRQTHLNNFSNQNKLQEILIYSFNF